MKRSSRWTGVERTWGGYDISICPSSRQPRPDLPFVISTDRLCGTSRSGHCCANTEGARQVLKSVFAMRARSMYRRREGVDVAVRPESDRGEDRLTTRSYKRMFARGRVSLLNGGITAGKGGRASRRSLIASFHDETVSTSGEGKFGEVSRRADRIRSETKIGRGRGRDVTRQI